MSSELGKKRLSGHRILVGPNEVAGFTSRIAVALGNAGAQVRFFNSHDHPFHPQVAESPNLHRVFRRTIGLGSRWESQGGWSRMVGLGLIGLVKGLVFVYACFWAQTVVMVGGKGFLGGGAEYAFLRLIGKRVIHVFLGTASRPRYLSGYAKGLVKGETVNPAELRRFTRRTKRQAERIRRLSRNASIVIENPLCGHFYERPFINFFQLGVPLDVAALENHPRKTDATPPKTDGKVRILHCPSRTEIKGSEIIQSVLARLLQEGLPIEFRQLSGIPRSQVLHEITLCDFVVDELYSDSPLAGFAAEAAAFGKPAIVGGYGWSLFRELFRQEALPPTKLCHPDHLEQAIRDLIADPASRGRLGAEARRFLQNQWSESAFADRFARIVAGEIPEDWWVKPQQVRYCHGMGLSEAEARRLISVLVQHCGPEALQLEHHPQLCQRLLAFGRGEACGY